MLLRYIVGKIDRAKFRGLDPGQVVLPPTANFEPDLNPSPNSPRIRTLKVESADNSSVRVSDLGGVLMSISGMRAAIFVYLFCAQRCTDITAAVLLACGRNPPLAAPLETRPQRVAALSHEAAGRANTLQMEPQGVEAISHMSSRRFSGLRSRFKGIGAVLPLGG